MNSGSSNIFGSSKTANFKAKNEEKVRNTLFEKINNEIEKASNDQIQFNKLGKSSTYNWLLKGQKRDYEKDPFIPINIEHPENNKIKEKIDQQKLDELKRKRKENQEKRKENKRRKKLEKRAGYIKPSRRVYSMKDKMRVALFVKKC